MSSSRVEREREGSTREDGSTAQSSHGNRIRRVHGGRNEKDPSSVTSAPSSASQQLYVPPSLSTYTPPHSNNNSSLHHSSGPSHKNRDRDRDRNIDRGDRNTDHKKDRDSQRDRDNKPGHSGKQHHTSSTSTSSSSSSSSTRQHRDKDRDRSGNADKDDRHNNNKKQGSKALYDPSNPTHIQSRSSTSQSQSPNTASSSSSTHPPTFKRVNSGRNNRGSSPHRTRNAQTPSPKPMSSKTMGIDANMANTSLPKRLRPSFFTVGWIGSCNSHPSSAAEAAASRSALLGLLHGRQIFDPSNTKNSSLQRLLKRFEKIESRPFRISETDPTVVLRPAQPTQIGRAKHSLLPTEEDIEAVDEDIDDSDDDDDGELLSDDEEELVADTTGLQFEFDRRSKLLHVHYVPSNSATASTSSSNEEKSSSTQSNFSSCVDDGWIQELQTHPPSFFEQLTAAQFMYWLHGDGVTQTCSAPYLRALLFLFTSCHYIIFVNSDEHVRVEYLKLMRVIQIMKRLLLQPPSSSLSPSSMSATSPSPFHFYTHLLAGLNISIDSSKKLAKFPNCFSLCFTPCVSFIVGKGNSNIPQNEAAERHSKLEDTLRLACARLQLTQSHNPNHGSSSQASTIMVPSWRRQQQLQEQAIANKKTAEKSYDSLYEPGQEEKSKPIASATSATSNHNHPNPLFYLHPTQTIIRVDFNTLLRLSSNDYSVEEECETQQLILNGLREDLERSIDRVKAELDLLITPTFASNADVQPHSTSTILSLIRDATTPNNSIVYTVSTDTIATISLVYTASNQLQCLTNAQNFLFAKSHTDAASSDDDRAFIQAFQRALRFDGRSPEYEALHERFDSAFKEAFELYQRAAATLGAAGSSQYYSLSVHQQRAQMCIKVFHRSCCGLELTSSGRPLPAANSPSSFAALLQCEDAPIESLQALPSPLWVVLEQQLRQALQREWTTHHRGCEALSILNHPCIHPFGHEQSALSNGHHNFDEAMIAPRLKHSPRSLLKMHVAPPRAIRLTCLCGFTQLKLTSESFDPREINTLLTMPCCAQSDPILPSLLESKGLKLLSEQNNGWNIYRIGDAAAYKTDIGFTKLLGFTPAFTRSCFLHSIRFSTVLPSSVSGSSNTTFSALCGLEYECPLGHRSIAPLSADDEDATHHFNALGFPSSTTPLFMVCTVCRYLRGALAGPEPAVTSQPTSGKNAREKMSKKDKKPGEKRAHKKEELTRLDSTDRTTSGGASSARPHDRYAQLRRVYFITPNKETATFFFEAQVKSTRPVHSISSTGTSSQTDSSQFVQEFDKWAWSTFLHTSGVESLHNSPLSIVSSSTTAATSGSIAVHPKDIFSPVSSNNGSSRDAPRLSLPPSSFLSITLPWIFVRKDIDTAQLSCMTLQEARHCVLAKHAVSLLS